MPELPEVQALADFLRERAVGTVIAGIEIGTINTLKTFDPPPTALCGLMIDGVGRYGKFITLRADGLYLAFHLARAGWLRWSESMPATVIRPGKGPIALRVRLDDPNRLDGAGQPGFDLTEAGTQKKLAVYVVRDPLEVPGIAALGPDPMAAEFDLAALRAITAGKRHQIKGLLRDQSVIAGVGNAYSDEILHAAKLSPFALAANLSDEESARLYESLREILTSAVATASGKPAKELKDAKRAGMRVHGRTGQACPVCGDVVREVSFADSSLQYCATCQTGGKPLADRRMSRLLK